MGRTSKDLSQVWWPSKDTQAPLLCVVCLVLCGVALVGCLVVDLAVDGSPLPPALSTGFLACGGVVAVGVVAVGFVSVGVVSVGVINISLVGLGVVCLVSCAALCVVRLVGTTHRLDAHAHACHAVLVWCPLKRAVRTDCPSLAVALSCVPPEPPPPPPPRPPPQSMAWQQQASGRQVVTPPMNTTMGRRPLVSAALPSTPLSSSFSSSSHPFSSSLRPGAQRSFTLSSLSRPGVSHRK